jgi:SAM-dependent methyltransferase
METQCQALVPQFDRILARIEAGERDQSIAHLAGLLDAVLLDCRDPAAVRQSLLAHPLGAALRHPAMAAFTQRLGIAQALSAREELARATLRQARQRGERCLVVDAPARANALIHAGRESFDLILAANLPDGQCESRLARSMGKAARRLVRGGRLVISAFLPGHLGCGWHSIWLARPVHRHAPDTLSRAAQAAGFEARLFHDASDCLVWADLRLRPSHRQSGDQS